MLTLKRSKRSIYPADKAVPLGVMRGMKYVTVGDREYTVGSEVAEPSDAAGALLSEPVLATEGDQSMVIGSRYRQLAEVEVGSYARAVAAVRDRRPASKPITPVDALDACTLLASAPDLIMAGPRSSSPVSLSTRPRGFAPGHPAIRGAAAIRARLKDKATMSLVGDRLLVGGAGGRLEPGVLDVIERAQRLLVAHLRDGIARCELPGHKGIASEAVSITAVGQLLVCAAHLAGELS